MITKTRKLTAGSGSSGSTTETADTLKSGSRLGVIDLLGEGQIGGLVGNSGKSIFLSGTPLLNENGESNFDNVTWKALTGTQDQATLGDGFDTVENTISLSQRVTTESDVLFTISDSDAESVRLVMAVSSLTKSDSKGNVRGSSVQFHVSLSINAGAFQPLGVATIAGKTRSRYQRAYEYELPRVALDGTTQATSWTFKVQRLTADSTSSKVTDDLYVDSYTSIIETKLTYPNSAIVGIQMNAEQFSSEPERSYLVDGLLIQVPSNRDNVTRKYDGVWSGDFKLASTDNPAWILHDLISNDRYGLGQFIPAEFRNPARLYVIGRYCDELVDDGFGNQEPRFTINTTINSVVDAYQLLSDICSVFNGMTYWTGSTIGYMADMPSDVSMIFSQANVIEGDFSYQSAARKDRHSVVMVSYNDPERNYETRVEYIEDSDLIERFGVRKSEITTFGCTTRGQAYRVGKWLLYTEKYQSGTVSFRVGIDSLLCYPGDVIQISDAYRAGKRQGGRIVNCTLNGATLDSEVEAVEGSRISIRLNDGTLEERTIATFDGKVVVFDKLLSKLPVANAVWQITTPNLEPLTARVVSIAQGENVGEFEITAVMHNSTKYDYIESDLQLHEPKLSTANAVKVLPPPDSVTLTAETILDQGSTQYSLSIDWEQVNDAQYYIVRYRKEEGNWFDLPAQTGLNATIDNVYSANYEASVVSVSATGVKSIPKYSALTKIEGSAAILPELGLFTATGSTFAIDLEWAFKEGTLGVAYTEIQTSTDEKSWSNLTYVPYPNSTHTMSGISDSSIRYFRARITDTTGVTGDWSDVVNASISMEFDNIISNLSDSLGNVTDTVSDLSTNLNEINEAAQKSADEAKAAALAAQVKAQEAAEKAQLARSELESESSARLKAEADMASKFADDLASQTEAKAAELETKIAQEKLDRDAAIQSLAQTTATSLNSAVSSEAERINALLDQEAQERSNSISSNVSTLRDEIVAKGKESTKEIEAKATTLAKDYNKKISDLQASTSADVKSLNDGITTLTAEMNDADGKTIEALNAYKTSTDKAVAAIETKATSAVTKSNSTAKIVTTLQSTVSNNTSSISALTTTVANADSALSERIDGLSASVASDKGELEAKIKSAETAVTNLDLATATKFDEVNSSISSINTDLESATLATSEAQKAAESAVSANTATAKDLTALKTRVTTAEGNIKKKADTTALTSLGTKVDGIGTNVTLNAEALTNLSSRLDTVDETASTAMTTASDAQTVASSAVSANSALSKRVDTLAASLTDLGESAETAVDVTAFNVLKGEVKSQGGQITALNDSTTALEASLKTANTNISKKANVATVTTLSNSVNTLEGKVTANTDSITKLNGNIATVNDSLANKVDAEALSNYYTKTDADNSMSGKLESFNASLTIGGDNLMPNTNFDTAVSPWAKGNTEVTTYQEKGVRTRVLRLVPLVATTGSSMAYAPAAYSKVVKLVKDQKYTLSFLARGNIAKFEYNHILKGGANEANLAIFQNATDLSETVWTRYTKTFTALCDTDSASVVLGYRTRQTDMSEWVEFAEILLQKGTKNTEWCPSSIDVQNSLDANASAISKTDANVLTVDGKVTTNANAITALTARTTTAENNIAKKADATALNDYYTKSDADKAIAGKVEEFNASLIQGGDNFIQDGRFELGYWSFSKDSSTTASGQVVDGWLEITSSTTAGFAQYQIGTSKGAEKLRKIPSGKLVLSYEAYCVEGDAAIGALLRGATVGDVNFGIQELTNEPKRYAKAVNTIRDLTTETGLIRLLMPYNGKIGTVRIRNVQIEKGDTATPYAPAIEDQIAGFAANAKAIETTNTEVARVNDEVSTQAGKISTLQTDLTKVDAKTGTAIENAATAQDTANAAVTANEATASNLSTLQTKFSKSAIASANLLVQSNTDVLYLGDQAYPHGKYAMGESWVVGEKYTLIWCTSFERAEGDTASKLSAFAGGGYGFVQYASTEKHERVVNIATFTKTSTSMNKNLYFYLTSKPEKGVMTTAIVHWAVVVKGELATTDAWIPSAYDYIPAVAESNASITTLTKTVNTADTALGKRIDTITSDFNSNKTDVSGRIDSVASSVSTLDSNVTKKLDTLTSNLAKTDGLVAKKADATALNSYYTKTEANSAIAGKIDEYNASLTVGGDNLQAGTLRSALMTNWGSYSTLSNSIVAGIRTPVWKLQANSTSIVNVGMAPLTSYRTAPFLEGESYVISFLVRGNVNALGYTYALKAKTNSANYGPISTADFTAQCAKINETTFTRVSFPFTALATHNAGSLLIGFKTAKVDSSEWIEVAEPVISKGTKAIDWCLSGTEINGQIDANANAISETNVNVDKVDGRVTSEADKLSKLTARVDTAESGIAKKADATALNNYYTKAQADTATAGKVDELKAALASGGSGVNLMPATYAMPTNSSLKIRPSSYTLAMVESGLFEGLLAYRITPTSVASNATNFFMLSASNSDYNINNEGSNVYIVSFYGRADTARTVKIQPRYTKSLLSSSDSDYVFVTGSVTEFNLTPEWQRFSFYTTMPAVAKAFTISGRQNHDSSGLPFDLTAIMVEQQIIPNNFTPSAVSFGVSVEQSSDATATSTLTAEVKDIDGRVTTNSNSITALGGRTDTLESGIKTKAESSALNDYYTKTQADSAIAGKIDSFDANLIIGGANLLDYTSDFSKSWAKGSQYASSTVTVIEGEISTVEMVNTQAGYNQWQCDSRDNLALGGIEAGKTYTFSVEAMAMDEESAANCQPWVTVREQVSSSSTSNPLAFTTGKGTLKVNEWVKISSTATITSDGTRLYWRAILGMSQIGTVRLRRPQLEEGTRATAWSPSNSEVLSSLTANANAIETTNTNVANVDGRVTSEADKLAKLTSRVTTAESGLTKKADATALNSYYTKTQADTAIAGAVSAYSASLSTGGSGVNLMPSKYAAPTDPNIKLRASSYKLAMVDSNLHSGLLAYEITPSSASTDPTNYLLISPNLYDFPIKAEGILANFIVSFYVRADAERQIRFRGRYIVENGSSSASSATFGDYIGTATTTWTRHSFKLSVPSTADAFTILLNQNYGGSGLPFQFTGVMVEKQIDPNVLTPSPFQFTESTEISGKATLTEKLDVQVTEIDGKVTTQAGKIEAIEGRTDTLESGIKTKVETATLTNYYTKTQADSAISGKVEAYDSSLSIGGANLISGTGWATLSDVGTNKDYCWNASNCSTYFFTSNATYLTGAIRINATTAASYVNGYVTPASQRVIKLVAGRTYTLSFVGQGTFTSLNYVYILRNSSEGANAKIDAIALGSGGNTRRSVTFVAPFTTATGGVLIGANIAWTTSDWFSIAELQLEEGSKPTPWTPYSGDIQNALDVNAKAIKDTNTALDTVDKAVKSSATDLTNLTATVSGLPLGGVNLIAKKNLVSGYLNASTGEVTSATAGKDVYDPTYYEIAAGEKLTGKLYSFDGDTTYGSTGRVAWYDSAQAFIGYVNWIFAAKEGSATTVTAPAKTAYFRFCTISADVKQKLERGGTATDWSPAPDDYTATANALSTLTTQVEKDGSNISSMSESLTALSGSLSSDNDLWQPQVWKIAGQLGYLANGNITSTSTHVHSGYIPVSAMSMQVTVSASTVTNSYMRIWAYTDAKVAIKQVINTAVVGTTDIALPSNTAYIRISSPFTLTASIKFLFADSKVLESVQATVTQHGKDIVQSNAKITSLKSALAATAQSVNINGGSSISEDLIFTNTTGSDVTFKKADASASGGNVIVFGDNADNDTVWVRPATLLTLDADRLYRVRCRIRRVSGAGAIYIGVGCLNADQSSYVMSSNATAAGLTASTYLGGGMKPALGEWQIYEYYIKGRSASASSGSGTLDSPKALPASACFFAPMIIANYNNTAGVVELDYLTLEVADAIGAQVEATNALQTSLNKVDGVATAAAKDISDLKVTIGGHTTSISNQSKVTDGIKAVKTVTVDNNGVLSGYGLISELADGKVTSSFGINADNFYIGSPKNGKKPFIVTTTNTTVNGTLYPAGTWIDSAYISKASIKLAHIDTANINSLSAICATIGTLRTKTSGARTEISDNLIQVFDANGKVRVKLGIW